MSIILSTGIGKAIFNLAVPEIDFAKYLLYIIWQSFFIAIFQVYQNLLRAQQRSKTYVYTQLAYFLLTTALVMYLVVVLKQGALGQIKANFFSSLFLCIFALFTIIRQYGLKISIPHIKDALLFGLPLVVHLLAAWGVSKIDRIILGNYRDIASVGIYDLGYKIALGISVITSAINFAWSPLFYETANQDKQAKQIFANIFNLYFFGISFIVLAISLFASDIVKLIATPAYFDAYKIIPFIALGYLLQGVYFMRVTPIFYKDKTKVLAILTLISAGINISLNYLFIKSLGMYGSAMALIGSYLFEAVATHIVSQKIYHIKYESRKILSLFGLLLVGLYIATKTNYPNFMISSLFNGLILALFFGFSIAIGIIQTSQLKKTYLLVKRK
jgi:O-antigen/teichoic acid export membrane protein